MARSLAVVVVALALAAALATAVPGDAAPAKPRRLGVPVLVTFLPGSQVAVNLGAGPSRAVALTGYAFGYVPRARIDRSRVVPIVLLRARAFPQATDLLFDTACGVLRSAARVDPATVVELTGGRGSARLHPDGTVTARARMAVRLRLDVRSPDGCDEPLAPTATVNTGVDVSLKGTARTMSSPSRAYILRVCLTPGTGDHCAGPVQKLTVKIGLRLVTRVELGAAGGRWSYPG
jgi:hypothetical protein